jgi:hypothetical protein
MLAHTNSQKRQNYQMCGLSVVKHQVSKDICHMLSRNIFTPPPYNFTPWTSKLFHPIVQCPLCHAQTCADVQSMLRFSRHQLSHHISSWHGSVSMLDYWPSIPGRSRDFLFTSICRWDLKPFQSCVQRVWWPQQLNTLRLSHTDSQNAHSWTSTHP